MSLLASVLAIVCLLTNADLQDQYDDYSYNESPEPEYALQYGDEAFRRILGGNATEISEWPSALQLVAGPVDGKVRHCGAVIISEDWALTAAHCVSGAEPDVITVRAGSTQREEGGTLHTLKDYIIHDKYDNNKRVPMYDIALLMVAEPFELTSPDVSAARLPHAREDVPVGSVAVKVGWGYFTYPSTELSPVLRVIDSFVISQEECAKHGLQVDYYHFCTAELCGSHKGTMRGDAGGPVFVGGILFGIHSSAFKNKSLIHPDKHIHIPHFREWIARLSGV